jgi:hypothetical protein
MTANRLYPVLSRYIRLWWLHRVERRRANSLTVALDLSDVGVLLLNRHGEVVFANTPAAALAQRSDGVQLQGAVVTASDVQSNVKLQAAIQNALYCNSIALPEDAARQRSPILALLRASGRRALIATVMHVGCATVDGRDPAVILYVVDPEQSVEHLLAPACAMYRLTPVEARLTHHLVRVMLTSMTRTNARIDPTLL